MCVRARVREQDFSLGWWGVKLTLFLVFGIGVFFIPSPFFESYADVARIVSIAFLLLQVFIIIDAVYSLQVCLRL